MTVQELVHATTWGEVRWHVLQRYPELQSCLRGFRSVYKKMSKCDPLPNDVQMTVIIAYEPPDKNDPEDKPWWDVKGRKANSDENWGLSACKFAEWAGFDFDDDILKSITPAQAVAHILWEATWWGYSERRIWRKRGKTFRR